MSYYFASFEIKEELPEGGHVTSGYGHTTCEGLPYNGIDGILNELTKNIAIKFGVEEKQIHITTFNKVE